MPYNVINYYKELSVIRGVHTGDGDFCWCCCLGECAWSIITPFITVIRCAFLRSLHCTTEWIDVLSDSFGYWNLSVVMLAMTVASLMARNSANARARKHAWKWSRYCQRKERVVVLFDAESACPRFYPTFSCSFSFFYSLASGFLRECGFNERYGQWRVRFYWRSRVGETRPPRCCAKQFSLLFR